MNPWLFFIPAAFAAVGAGYLWASRSGVFGSKVALIQRSLGDARWIAENLVPADYDVVFIDSPQDALNAIARYSKISRFALISHGGPSWVLDRGLTYQLLAQQLAPVLTRGAIVGFGGCSGGRSPQEPDVWTPQAFADGGLGSYAALFRDALRALGAPGSVEVRAHAIQGHTMANPSGRIFVVSETGPGRTVKPAGEDWQAFIARFGGEPAAAWLLGVT